MTKTQRDTVPLTNTDFLMKYVKGSHWSNLRLKISSELALQDERYAHEVEAIWKRLAPIFQEQTASLEKVLAEIKERLVELQQQEEHMKLPKERRFKLPSDVPFYL